MLINAELVTEGKTSNDVLVIRGILIADEGREEYLSKVTLKKVSSTWSLVDLCIKHGKNSVFQSIKGMYHPIIEATILDAALAKIHEKNPLLV
ncbi:hypothetical protein M3936_19810 [Sutcliffiella horikoshii]|uniref:hypothetical protein n=1 Tax=Sutcliffiella horikoshii TaxID=79883 RepID=UPI00203B5A5C|nr:hypothetical protein [Sutcliffiella horikoshii]MCM3619821.1 hypothetical protein [Sutcliffiella horikoshii]